MRYVYELACGWGTTDNSRPLQNWGWACEMIDAVEVVTAKGEVILCNAEENPDLFWAARGAGSGMSSTRSIHCSTAN